MHLQAIADRVPDRAAVIMAGSGETITFGELAERANRLAHVFRARGLERGASVAVFLENNPRFLEVVWAAQQSGLYYTAINSHLTADEAAYIVDDCGAQLLVSSAALAGLAEAIDTPALRHRLMVDGAVDGWEGYEDVVAGQPTTPVADACEGDFMLYSSGTTGRPKGIQRPLTFPPLGQGSVGAVPYLQALGMQYGDVYLCPAPLYHAAPMAWSMSSHRLGSTVVVLERFDPIAALTAVERHRVTHVQLVPTMFVRMLKLPDAERTLHDLSSLRAAVHAAAPCPVEVKRQMIEWWGPIISEYYSATEGIGATFITGAARPLLGGGVAMSSLAVRLDAVESRLAIGQLPIRYAMAVDSRDIDTWVSLFVPDVQVGRDAFGREALRAYITPLLRTFRRSIHQICGHRVDLDPADPDRASGATYCRAEHEVDDRWIVMAICYFDEYQRSDGEWLFRRRREKHWYSADVNEQPQAVGFDSWKSGAPPALPGAFPTWTRFWEPR